MATGIYKHRPHSEDTKHKMRKNHKGMLGKQHTEDTKKKMRESMRGKNTWMKGKKPFLGHHHSEGSNRKNSESHKIISKKGLECHFWKGGITPETNKRISTSEWRTIRKQCYKRDNYTCQICKTQYKDKNGNGMNAHHIIPYRITQDDSLGNLITLCDSCHIREERKYYKTIGEQLKIGFN